MAHETWSDITLAGSAVGRFQIYAAIHRTIAISTAGAAVTATRNRFDGRDSYYHLDLDRCADALAETGAALHPALREDAAPPIPPVDRERSRRIAVLFVCTGNSARSPIAEALLRQHNADRVTVTSAGSRPKPHVHPNTVRVLGDQFGIDITGHQPRHLDTLAGRRFDHVITLCDKARETCPSSLTTRGESTGASPTRRRRAIPSRAATPPSNTPRPTSTPASGTCCRSSPLVCV